MGLNWNFQRDGGIPINKPSVGEVWKFPGTTHYHNMQFLYDANTVQSKAPLSYPSKDKLVLLIDWIHPIVWNIFGLVLLA